MPNSLATKKEKPNAVKIPDSVLLQILKLEHPSDCLALYVLYCSESEKQKSNQIKYSISKSAKELNGSEKRIRDARNQLIKLGLIELNGRAINITNAKLIGTNSDSLLIENEGKING